MPKPFSDEVQAFIVEGDEAPAVEVRSLTKKPESTETEKTIREFTRTVVGQFRVQEFKFSLAVSAA